MVEDEVPCSYYSCTEDGWSRLEPSAPVLVEEDDKKGKNEWTIEAQRNPFQPSNRQIPLLLLYLFLQNNHSLSIKTLLVLPRCLTKFSTVSQLGRICWSSFLSPPLSGGVCVCWMFVWSLLWCLETTPIIIVFSSMDNFGLSDRSWRRFFHFFRPFSASTFGASSLQHLISFQWLRFKIHEYIVAYITMKERANKEEADKPEKKGNRSSLWCLSIQPNEKIVSGGAERDCDKETKVINSQQRDARKWTSAALDQSWSFIQNSSLTIHSPPQFVGQTLEDRQRW